MSDETKKKMANLRTSVLNAIKTDHVTMRSRYYFIARSALWTLGAILAFSLALYLISFIAFIFRGNGLHLLPFLGGRGWSVLFLSLPWLLLLSVFGIFIVLQALSMHFSFVYKRPLVHTVLGSIFLLVLGGILLAQTTIHERAYQMQLDRGLPIAGMLYEHALLDQDDVHVGIFTEFNASSTSYLLERRDGTELIVVVTDDTRVPPFELELQLPVLVLGENEDGVVTAVGIRPFKPTQQPLRVRGKDMRGQRLAPPPPKN